ncbi:MAG TPA: hypothetical protein VE975_02745 [Actinomycetota bacterium]|nr:hypothetical protein [Actinomycetota bacterium]
MYRPGVRRQEAALRPAIFVVWLTGLVGALIATLVILKEVALVLRELRAIHRLAEFTREAAQGLATNASAASRLATSEEPTRRLREGARAVASASATLEQKLDSLAAGGDQEGG